MMDDPTRLFSLVFATLGRSFGARGWMGVFFSRQPGRGMTAEEPSSLILWEFLDTYYVSVQGIGRQSDLFQAAKPAR